MNKIITKHVPIEELSLKVKTVNKYLQIKQNSDVYDDLHRMIFDLYSKYKPEFTPVYQYRILAVKSVHDDGVKVILGNQVRFTGIGIHRLLAKSKYAALFVATIGSDIDPIITELQRSDLLAGYCLEGIASALVTSLLDQLKQELEKAATNQSCELSYRYAPGYAHWDLKEQSNLFSALQPEQIDVHLTDAFFVVPRNSLTGVYGFNEKTT